MKPDQERPCAFVWGKNPITISRHVVPCSASLFLGYVEAFHGSICNKGRPGRPSSKLIKIRLSLIKNATPTDADTHPVHFRSFISLVNSFACNVYPIIPLFKKTGTHIALKSPVASPTPIRNSLLKSHCKKSLVGVPVLIDAKTDRFLVIPIEAPPGVSFVQKYPY